VVECVNSANVTTGTEPGWAYVETGGIVGESNYVFACANNGSVKTESGLDFAGLGGIVGICNYSVNFCRNNGPVSAGQYYTYTGGIVGISNTVNGSVTAADVSGEYAVGGIVGMINGGLLQNNIVLSNVIIIGEWYVGGIVGIVGWLDGVIKNNVAGGSAIKGYSGSAHEANRVMGGVDEISGIHTLINNCANPDMEMTVSNSLPHSNDMVLNGAPVPEQYIDLNDLNGGNCDFPIPEDVDDLACLAADCACPQRPIAPSGRSLSFNTSVPGAALPMINASNALTRGPSEEVAAGLGDLLMDIGTFINKLGLVTQTLGNVVNYGMDHASGLDELTELNNSVASNTNANAGITKALSRAICCIASTVCCGGSSGPIGPKEGCVWLQVVVDVSGAPVSGLEYDLYDPSTGTITPMSTQEFGVLKLDNLKVGVTYTLMPIFTSHEFTDSSHELYIDSSYNVHLSGSTNLTIRLGVNSSSVAGF